MKTGRTIALLAALSIGLGAPAAGLAQEARHDQTRAIAAPEHETLMRAARIDAMAQIVATEGARHGLGLEQALFPGRGGRAWERAVSAIQSPDRLAARVAEVLEHELSPQDAAAAARFLDGDPGRRITAREVSARRRMLDGEVEQEARSVSTMLARDGVPRAALIDEMIERMDLVSVNVMGGLNANYAFYRGLGDGGALRDRLTEDEMIAMVREQEDDIRAATGVWLRSYLALAYAPLTDADLRAYVDFATGPAGRRYMGAMSAAFGTVFEETSYALGRAAATFIVQQDA